MSFTSLFLILFITLSIVEGKRIMSAMPKVAAEFTVKPYENLPEMNMSWLSLRDHFIATVGPYSGTGEPLGNLLVIADAKFQPRSRFPDHPHRDMEILTWVSEGTLQHLDNNGTNQSIEAGHLQLMSARDGIFHAEGNLSDKPLRMFQIWIQPNIVGGKPSVDHVKLEGRGFKLLAAPDAAPLTIRQNLWLYAAELKESKETIFIPEGKYAYGISIGSLRWNGKKVSDGDGLLIQSGEVQVEGTGQALIHIQNKD